MQHLTGGKPHKNKIAAHLSPWKEARPGHMAALKCARWLLPALVKLSCMLPV